MYVAVPPMSPRLVDEDNEADSALKQPELFTSVETEGDCGGPEELGPFLYLQGNGSAFQDSGVWFSAGSSTISVRHWSGKKLRGRPCRPYTLLLCFSRVVLCCFVLRCVVDTD